MGKRRRRDRRTMLAEALRVDRLIDLAFDLDADVADMAGRELLRHFGVREVRLVCGDKARVIRWRSQVPRPGGPYDGSILGEDSRGWH